jgi:hypothetical protein
MFKQTMDIILILFMSLAVFTHFLRLINLFIKLPFLQKFKFISDGNPSKSQLAMYYLLTIAICAYAVILKLSNFG